MIKWRMDRGVTKQLAAMKKGFAEIMPVTLMQGFDAQEMEFIIAGTLEIDVDDWKEHTEYRNGEQRGDIVWQSKPVPTDLVWQQ